MSRPVAFFTWDGPGAPYLRALYLPLLAKLGRQVEVVQLTYGGADEVRATRAAAEVHGIAYRPVTVPPGRRATVGGALLLREARRLVERDVTVIARSLLPVGGMLAARVPANRLVFDADGFAADERVDFAGWSRRGPGYGLARVVEAAALARAGSVVTRTRAAAEILRSRNPTSGHIVVAPNGSDIHRFRLPDAAQRRRTREMLRVGEHDALVVYSGSLGRQYRPDLMASFVKALRARRAGATRLLVLSADTSGAAALAELAGDAEARSAAPEEVAVWLGAADFGLAFREPAPSQRGVCPIKVGEYLLCGVPVVSNRGVGDLDEILGDANGGILAESCTASGVLETAAVAAVAEFVPERVRDVGLRWFSVERASAGYLEGVERAEASQS